MVFLNPAFQESARQGRPVFALEGPSLAAPYGGVFTIPTANQNGASSRTNQLTGVPAEANSLMEMEDHHMEQNILPRINNFMEDTDSPDYSASAIPVVQNLMEQEEEDDAGRNTSALMNEAPESRRYLSKRAAQPGLFGGRYGYRGHHHHHHHGHGHGHGHGFRFPYFG
jgi:hypothetical protein